MQTIKGNQITKFELVHYIFRDSEKKYESPVLKDFKNSVYKEIEKYEFSKSILQEEINRSKRKIKMYVILLIAFTVFFLLMFLL